MCLLFANNRSPEMTAPSMRVLASSWRRGFSSGKKTALVVSRVCWSACLVQAIHGHLCIPEL